MKKILKALLVMLVVFVIQSCAVLETDMKVNKDFTGETKTKITTATGMVTKEQIQAEIKRLGIEKYNLKQEKTKEGTEQYLIEIKWNNEEELHKILKFIGAGISGVGKDTGNNKIDKIFNKEKGLVVVNMGEIGISRLTIKIDGKIVQDETVEGSISEKGDEITYTTGQNVSFSYKPNGNPLVGIFSTIIIVIILVGGIYFLVNKKKNKSEVIEEDVIIEEVVEENEETSKKENIEVTSNDETEEVNEE